MKLWTPPYSNSFVTDSESHSSFSMDLMRFTAPCGGGARIPYPWQRSRVPFPARDCWHQWFVFWHFSSRQDPPRSRTGSLEKPLTRATQRLVLIQAELRTSECQPSPTVTRSRMHTCPKRSLLVYHSKQNQSHAFFHVLPETKNEDKNEEKKKIKDTKSGPPRAKKKKT